MGKDPNSKLPFAQTGQALVTVVLLLVVGASAVIFSFTTPGKVNVEQEKKTALALQQAMEALIGYAAKDNNRPGSLPCPDGDNDGSSESLIPTDCAGYVGGSNVYIGRLPWRTLGIPDNRDGNGERLWYAVSREFARNPACGAACPLNSDTPGQLTVNGPGGAANVIAVVFSPGAVLPGQVRDTANENNVVNYLDGAENVDADSTFEAALASSTFNDTLLLITRDNLFPTVEKRVAREVRQSLLTYFTANNHFPYAQPFDGSTNWIDGLTRGRVPTQTCALPVAGPILPNPVNYPAWFTTNNWHQVMVYAVAPRCTPVLTVTLPFVNVGSLPGCNNACTPWFLWFWMCRTLTLSVPNGCNNLGSPLITVTGVTNNAQALILPGSYRFATQPNPPNVASRLLEDVQNHDNDGADNFVYVMPQRSTTNNDQLLVVAP